ncbi:MAG: IS1634 family transposase, partial [Nitrospiraceae bacterium]
MFLRATTRKKDGKEHRYWSIVENRRLSDGRVIQRHVLYLGEITPRRSWRGAHRSRFSKTKTPRTLALFPEDRCEGLVPDETVVRLRLRELRLCRPRQWGACWLALWLWQELRLDEFWAKRLLP